MTDAHIFDANRIERAFATLFSGHGTREDAMLVLRDLQGVSGFYGVTGGSMPAEQVKFSEGRRAVYRWLLDRIGNDEGAMGVERDARNLVEVPPPTKD